MRNSAADRSASLEGLVVSLKAERDNAEQRLDAALAGSALATEKAELSAKELASARALADSLSRQLEATDRLLKARRRSPWMPRVTICPVAVLYDFTAQTAHFGPALGIGWSF